MFFFEFIVVSTNYKLVLKQDWTVQLFGTKGKRDKLKILPRDRMLIACPVLSWSCPGHRDKKIYLSRDKGTMWRLTPVCPGTSRGKATTNQSQEQMIASQVVWKEVYGRVGCTSWRDHYTSIARSTYWQKMKFFKANIVRCKPNPNKR